MRSTTCRLNSTVCRRHFAILAILPPFAAKCVFSACLSFGVQSINADKTNLFFVCFSLFSAFICTANASIRRNPRRISSNQFLLFSAPSEPEGRRARPIHGQRFSWLFSAPWRLGGENYFAFSVLSLRLCGK
jgi:hypothetical protein